MPSVLRFRAGDATYDAPFPRFFDPERDQLDCGFLKGEVCAEINSSAALGPSVLQRPTAEIATASGGPVSKTRAAVDGGRMSVVHWPLVRVWSTQRKGFPVSPGSQLILILLFALILTVNRGLS